MSSRFPFDQHTNTQGPYKDATSCDLVRYQHDTHEHTRYTQHRLTIVLHRVPPGVIPLRIDLRTHFKNPGKAARRLFISGSLLCFSLGPTPAHPLISSHRHTLATNGNPRRPPFSPKSLKILLNRSVPLKSISYMLTPPLATHYRRRGRKKLDRTPIRGTRASSATALLEMLYHSIATI